MSNNENKTKYRDFVGFTFADTHSSTLNLFRVNDSGDRYTWDTVPTFSDKTVQVGGRDGTYLFGSDYSRRDITINVAFDNVGEEDFQKIQAWGADKKIHKLIFDEWPYKYYNVKLTNPPQLKFLCFDESANYSEEAYKGNTTRRRRIYKGEGTFKFTCYEPFARGCILSERNMYDQKPEKVQVYINRNANEPIEIPISAMKGIDTASLYLSSDIYDREEWGMAYQNSDGTYWRGQYNPDPNLEEGESHISTSYYAYQPQRVDLKVIDGENTIQLVSNYQTYLYPIDFQHGFIGTVDRNGTTNGKLIDSHTDATDYGFDSMLLDPLDDNHQQGKRTEIVQYDPGLKVTYGKASGIQETEDEPYEEYGVYRITEYGTPNKIVKVNAIDHSIAAWINNALEITDEDSEKVYQTKLLDEDELKNTQFDISNWDEKEMYNKLFVVQNATNTLLSADERSIYMLPNGKGGQYKLKCKYKDLLGNPYTIDLDINLVDSNSPHLKNDDGKLVESITTEYYASTTHSYNEWAPYLGLPAKEPEWENGAINLVNPGNIDMPFIADYEKQDYTSVTDTLELQGSDKKIKFEIPSFNEEDDGIFVDTDLRIIRGYTLDDNHRKIPNSNIYNRYITEGDFFYIPCGNSTITSNCCPELVYEYRYL